MFNLLCNSGLRFLLFNVQLMLAPLTSLYFHKIAFGGMLANVVAIPLISVILPLGFLTIFLPLPFLNQFYIASGKFLMHILFTISHFVSANKILLIDFFSTDAWQAYLIIFIIGLITLFWSKKSKIRRKILVTGIGILIISLIFFCPDFFLRIDCRSQSWM